MPLAASHRAKAIVEALGGTWRGTRGECRCPAHDDHGPSLSVRLGDRAILFHCFAGCDTRDVLTALRRRKLHDAVPLTMPRPKAMADHRALALRLWKASQPIAGSPAADYLAARGLAPPYPRCLRYNPRTIVGAGDQRQFFPAMIAAVENDLGVVAVQRTCLDLADILHKPLSKPKIALGLLATRPSVWRRPERSLALLRASRTPFRQWPGSERQPGRWAASNALDLSPSPNGSSVSSSMATAVPPLPPC